jgi:hypothetical protein
MKLAITITYNSGEEAIYTAQPPEWAKWEQKTGNIISQASEKIGVSDLMFFAYHAHKREAAGKAVKPYETWMETVADIQVGDANPKAIQ